MADSPRRVDHAIFYRFVGRTSANVTRGVISARPTSRLTVKPESYALFASVSVRSRWKAGPSRSAAAL